MGRKEIAENPFVDLAYSRSRYEQEKEMIERGIDPYNSEYAIGVDFEDEAEDREENIGNRGRFNESAKKIIDRDFSYRVNGYEDARQIISNFSREKRYLKSLIARVREDGDYADNLDYRGLLREGNKIRGIAKRILKSRKN